MAFQRPGVYVQETLNPVPTSLGPNSDSIGAFVGQNDRGPVTPTLVTSWSQYASLFGTWNTSADNSLPVGLYMFFANGGSRAYVCRTVGTGSVQATRVFTDRAGTPLSTLNIKAVNAGTWGNSLNISIEDSLLTGYFTLTVYYGGNTDSYIVERFTDVTMVSTDARYAPSVINAQSSYVTATDLNSASTGTTKNPSVVSNQALATGANGSTPNTAAYSASFSTFDIIKQSLVLNVPNQTTAAVVNAAISYAAGRGDVFVVIDGVNDTVANQLTLAASYTASSYGAVYYPQVTITDPTLGVGGATGATKTIGAGAAVTGLIMATDASRGVYKAPAGLTARLGGVVSVSTLTNTELDSLNSASAAVNAIKYVPGTGYVVMGSRTLKTGYVDKYVPVRRTLIYLTKSLKDLTEFAVFEPNDEALWRRLNSSCSGFLTSFWSQGGLRGATPSQAFFVKVDATNNTQSSIDNGEVRIEVGVALQRPAEFIIIKIGQFDGGSTVTVA
jgi:phage tail sheath protein FI